MPIDVSIGSLDGVEEEDSQLHPGAKRSSKITVDPVRKLLRKEKTGRRATKTLYEFLALGVWHIALERASMGLTSPAPVAIDTRDRLYMTFVPGDDGESLVKLG